MLYFKDIYSVLGGGNDVKKMIAVLRLTPEVHSCEKILSSREKQHLIKTGTGSGDVALVQQGLCKQEVGVHGSAEKHFTIKSLDTEIV